MDKVDVMISCPRKSVVHNKSCRVETCQMCRRLTTMQLTLFCLYMLSVCFTCNISYDIWCFIDWCL